MQINPNSFGTTLLKAAHAALRSAATEGSPLSDDIHTSMARRIISAATRGESDPIEVKRSELIDLEPAAAATAEVVPYPAFSLPIAHRYSA